MHNSAKTRRVRARCTKNYRLTAEKTAENAQNCRTTAETQYKHSIKKHKNNIKTAELAEFPPDGRFSGASPDRISEKHTGAICQRSPQKSSCGEDDLHCVFLSRKHRLSSIAFFSHANIG